MITLGLFSGPFYDKGYFRSLSLSGIMIVVFGLMMTSISQSYYQIFLAQGVCIGIGNGLLFLPSVSLVTVYFSTKRAAATGLASTGSGVGKLFPATGSGQKANVLPTRGHSILICV
jgi:nitrate/nitrite transporter NarK